MNADKTDKKSSHEKAQKAQREKEFLISSLSPFLCCLRLFAAY